MKRQLSSFTPGFSMTHRLLFSLLAFSASAQALHGMLDANGNGLSDVWESAYDAASLPPTADTDGDGRTNLDEASEGTDPRSARSVFVVTSFGWVDGMVTWAWQSQPGKRYQAQKSDASGTAWTPVGDIVVGDGSQKSLQVSASAKLRLTVSDADSDGDGLVDWEERIAGFNTAQSQTFSGQPDKSSLQAKLATANVVSLATSDASAAEQGKDTGTFVLTRSGNLNPLRVSLSLSGSAQNGADYQTLPSVVNFPFGVSTAYLTVTPHSDAAVESSETVTLTLAAGAGYALGPSSQATVTISDVPSRLYLAALRADPASSVAHGTASLALNSNDTEATLTVTPSSLSSAPTGATLFNASGNATLAALNAGQALRFTWSLSGQSGADLLSALRTGQAAYRLATAAFPGGEISGRFTAANGTPGFVAPAAAPTLFSAKPTANQAARFLTQATFGPTHTEIERVQALGYEAWIEEQLAKPITWHRGALEELAKVESVIHNGHRQEVWWAAAVTAPDQLRQRVAFALSEILVVSDDSGILQNQPRALASYYDLLVGGAFGNYRPLLEEITLNPAMGVYLSMVRNAKPDPVRGINPDENYAREIMQLFTVGLDQLHPDGSVKLDAEGQPLPAYDQTEIIGLAHAFTGWGFHSTDPHATFYYNPPVYDRPMLMYEYYHDTGPKRILGGVTLPAGQTGVRDLRDALDALFRHPNVGPYVCHKLIQRLVTSNPSPGYVYRVAKVFDDNGQGVRGDLKAVVKALLLDHEARADAFVSNPSYGKVREPLLRMTHLWRAFDARAQWGRYSYTDADKTLGQAAMRSPTVFNFFKFGYAPPGRIAEAGLVAPEFQIATDITSITINNEFGTAIFAGINYSDRAVLCSWTRLEPFKNDHPRLLDQLNLLLLSGQMSSKLRSELSAMLGRFPADSWEKIPSAVNLILISPEYVVQK